MRYGLVLTLVVVFFMAFTAFAFAQYDVNWSDDFNNINSGAVGANVAGTNGWVQALGTVNASPKYSLAPTSDGLSYQKSLLQPGGLRSAIKNNLKPLHVGGGSYYTGVVRAWVYDPYPMTTAGALITSKVDTRVGVYSNTGTTQGDSGAMTYVIAAGITDTRGPYWTAYAASGLAVMNGTTADAIAPGYTLHTAGLAPAPRKQGWNSVIIAWSGDKVAKTMSADFYVNLDYADPRINARLDCNNTGTRYAAIESVAGLFIGSGSTFPTNAWVDDVSFSGMGPGPCAYPPHATSITPNSGMNTGSVSITDLEGHSYFDEISMNHIDFQPGATVKLMMSGQSDIDATNVNVVSSSKITCTFDLTGKPPGKWDVAVTNPCGSHTSISVALFTIIDPSPVINLVTVSPQMVAASDTVHVSVDVTDNAEVMSVKANGTALTHSSGSSWSGDIVANSTLGLHTVTVVASDAANNVTTNASQSYKTAQALGIRNRDLVRDVTAGSTGQYLFTTWGRVTRLDANTFELEDGSVTPVRVTASGHGLATGDYAFARGIWSVTAIPPTLISCSPWIEKVNL